MSRSAIGLAALALLVYFPTARADEPASQAPDAGGLFKQLDENDDGLLASDEIPEDRKTLFDRLLRKGDENSDGKLSAEEFAAALSGGGDSNDEPSERQRPARPDRGDRPEPGAFFARLDANGDGKVELDEVPEPGRERFEKLIARADKDGDGALSREEFTAVVRRAGGEPGKPGGPKKPDQAKRPQAGRDPSELFKRMDRNADGKVTADEVPEERRERFKRLIEHADKDGDGAVSREEFTAAFARRSPPAGAKPKKPSTPARPAAFGRMPPGLFAALDTDHDGKLASAEIEAAPEALRKLDADGDGTVTLREIMATAARKQKP